MLGPLILCALRCGLEQALGLIASATGTEPAHEALRCVPESWVIPAAAPSMEWSNSGLGGQEGALWTSTDSKMRLMSFGLDPPASGKLFKDDFTLQEAEDACGFLS